MTQQVTEANAVNGVPLNMILNPIPDDPAGVERIPARAGTVRASLPIAIVEYDTKWPEYFETYKSRILDAFVSASSRTVSQTTPGNQEAERVEILSLEHVGSTSVPGLAAKAVIDIDLVLTDNGLDAESFYVPCLEAAGFDFRLREPKWHGHRFFACHRSQDSRGAEEDIIMPDCNLHVWGPRSPEVERHRLFRDWLRRSKEDRDTYAKIKVECALASREGGESMAEYTARKEETIRNIVAKACKGFDYIA